MPKVSVIIPVYGVEKYIERCARSLFEQTLDDIEYIFVDDCTCDNSISILNNVIKCYPNRKSQVTIIKHDENRGLPQARRTGVLSATSDYVIHCDSDDWVDRHMYEKMYNTAIEKEADVVICNYSISDGTKHTIVTAVTSQDVKESMREMLYMKRTWSLVNKLFKRSLYDENIEYPKYGIGEDMALTLQLMSRTQRIALVPESLYYYYANPGSMSKIAGSDKAQEKLRQASYNISIVDNLINNKNYVFLNKPLNYVKYFDKTLLHPFLTEEACYRQWKDTFPLVEKHVIFDRNVALRHRIKCLLITFKLYPLSHG